MRAAGINPALAYSQGGASTPGGAVAAPAENPVTSALAAVQARKTLSLLDSQITKTRQEGRAAKAAADVATDRSNYLRARGKLTTPDGRTIHGVPLLHDLIDSEVSGARAQATNTAALAERNKVLTEIGRPMADLSNRMGELLPLLTFLTGAAGPAANVLKQLKRRK